MARSTTRTGKRSDKKSSKGPKVEFTRSADKRMVGNSQFLLLSEDKKPTKFVGYALFNPDPGAEDNPGYVEFGEHWDQSGNRFVPCWGEKNGCVFCKAGIQPSQRAIAAFLVTAIDGEELDEPEIKLFRMNWTMIKEWIDELDEEGAIIGKKVRIKCISRSDGEYTTKFYDKEKLAAKDLKAAVKEVPDLELVVQRNLDRAMQAMRVSDILEEDDDDDEDDDEDVEEVTTKKRGRPAGSKNKKKDEEEDEDEDDEDDDDEDEDESDDDKDEDDSDDEDDDDDDEDSDEDEDESDDEEDEEDEDDEDEDDKVLAGTFTVVSSNETESTFTLKEVDSPLYLTKELLEDVEFEDFKKGDKITIKAEKDEDDDWVATEFKKEKGAAKKKPAAKKTSTKKKK